MDHLARVHVEDQYGIEGFRGCEQSIPLKIDSEMVKVSRDVCRHRVLLNEFQRRRLLSPQHMGRHHAKEYPERTQRFFIQPPVILFLVPTFTPLPYDPPNDEFVPDDYEFGMAHLMALRDRATDQCFRERRKSFLLASIIAPLSATFLNAGTLYTRAQRVHPCLESCAVFRRRSFRLSSTHLLHYWKI